MRLAEPVGAHHAEEVSKVFFGLRQGRWDYCEIAKCQGGAGGSCASWQGYKLAPTEGIGKTYDSMASPVLLYL